MWSKMAAIFSLLIPLALFAATREGQELIGTPAPAFNLDHWVNSSRLELSNLKGKVLLVRWWTDTCELCAVTAPALRKLQDEYGTKGFRVIGIFHPKPAGDWNLERVKRAAAHYQFTFPVADDGDWKALSRWWLNGTDRDEFDALFPSGALPIDNIILPNEHPPEAAFYKWFRMLISPSCHLFDLPSGWQTGTCLRNNCSRLVK